MHCQLLCYALKALVFIKKALKLSYISKKTQNFQALGATPPDPRASSGWGLCPQTPVPTAAGVFAPTPPNTASHCEFLAMRLTSNV